MGETGNGWRGVENDGSGVTGFRSEEVLSPSKSDELAMKIPVREAFGAPTGPDEFDGAQDVHLMREHDLGRREDAGTVQALNAMDRAFRAPLLRSVNKCSRRLQMLLQHGIRTVIFAPQSKKLDASFSVFVNRRLVHRRLASRVQYMSHPQLL